MIDGDGWVEVVAEEQAVTEEGVAEVGGRKIRV